ncbi:sulfate permease [Methylacidiphilum sp. Yel]|jgi:SulP family sulfate permease|uniref:SulP family inorganic anion transporter n=1 Tax=Methylacidiphilum sp. Yel TaxID=1847730 RepID=UPI00106C3F1A|nr:SulP family inorganic anion transporter [Methylacidiphilum sp. Yel]TFE71016.1 sulfate permease [Methylacidiphilum sp. Yel]
MAPKDGFRFKRNIKFLIRRSIPSFNRWKGRFIEQIQDLHFDLGPFRDTIKNYSKEKFQTDFKAGINVALLSIPQGMAYALIAGLPVQYGLYACAISSLLGPLFQSSRYVVLGPTNATSVLLFSTYLNIQKQVDKLSTLPFVLLFVGIILILISLFRMAGLTQYVSRTVIVGYITGASFLIIAGQLHRVMGFELSEAYTFFDIVLQTLSRLHLIQWPSVAIGICSLGCWWLLKKRFPKLPAIALSLVLMSFLGTLMHSLHLPIEFLKPIPMATWPITLPTMNFHWFSTLASMSFALAFFAAVEGTGIARSLANRSGESLELNRDLFAQGIANIGCSFFSGMPVSGSLTRSALNWASKPATQLANLWSGILMSIALLFGGPLLGYIPIPALSALVISAGLSLINPNEIKIALTATRFDFTVFVVTFIGALLTPLDFAIGLGIGASILFFLKQAGEPFFVEYTFDTEQGDLREKIKGETTVHPDISIIHIEGELFFGVSELFRTQINKILALNPKIRVVILRMRNAHHLDATNAMALEELHHWLTEQGKFLLISGVIRPVFRVLRNSGVLDRIGRKNVFPLIPTQPNLSTRQALIRAQELLGKKESEVKIFFEKLPKK